MDLLKETLEVLKYYKKTPADVKWCGSEEWGWFTWEEFVKATSFKSDSEYPEVAIDLLIVGDGWWLERYECEEDFGWEYKTLPKKPKTHKIPKRIIPPRDYYGDIYLEDLNKEQR